jgi:hypothetical protein
MKPRFPYFLFSATVLLLPALLATYVTAYFWLGELGKPPRVRTPSDPLTLRCYSSPAVASLFRPAAIIEGAITGRKVATGPEKEPFR